jgi:hypothetical protein
MFVNKTAGIARPIILYAGAPKHPEIQWRTADTRPPRAPRAPQDGAAEKRGGVDRRQRTKPAAKASANAAGYTNGDATNEASGDTPKVRREPKPRTDAKPTSDEKGKGKAPVQKKNAWEKAKDTAIEVGAQ